MTACRAVVLTKCLILSKILHPIPIQGRIRVSMQS
jgi:hypothetical protein